MTAADGFGAICAGLDIGGTAVRVVMWGQGRCLAETSVPTADFAAGDSGERLNRLAALVAGLRPGGSRLLAVGIGASGPVDVARGVIENPYTLPALSGFPLVPELERRLGCPVVIEGDAVVAAVGEHRVGAGRGASRMLMVTLGTGIGVALLLDGAPFRGPGGAHPESGHIPIASGGGRCYCGVIGCWEQLASRAALQVRLLPLLPAGTPPDRLVPDAAALASTRAAIREAFGVYGQLVGRGLCTLHTVYMPDVTVLGGSAAAHLALFRDGMDQELQRPPAYIAPTPVRVAVLANAGAIGAALLAERRIQERGTAGLA